jgi:hypothetical protein
MAGGAPVPIPVQGEDAMILCMEDIQKIANAKFSTVIRGKHSNKQEKPGV